MNDELRESADDQRQHARRLAEDGRFGEAIVLGQHSLRHERDLRFETELRDWRHRAYYETETGVGRPDWLPDLADPWPARGEQIPEIGREDLSADVLGGALHHHGSLIVRGLLSPESAATCVAMIDRVFADRGADGVDGYYSKLVPVNGHNLASERAFVSDVAILMVDAPEFLSNWAAELETAGVIDAVGGYLGERPAISANKATLYRLPHDAGSQWHQDGAFLGRDIRTVNLWVACTECGVDAPGLDVIPWRLDSIVDTGTHDSSFSWSVGEGMVEAVANGRPISSPRFMPGDAILFDQLCLHRTGVRPGMTRGRYAIETWLFAPSHYGDGVPLII